MPIKRIALFGSTGSIGLNTLDVVRRNPGHFEISHLAANRNAGLLADQIAEFHPGAVALGDPAAGEELLSGNPKCEVLSGANGLRELASRSDYDIFVGALVGFAGLAPTIEAVRQGKRVALANKETLVVAGEILTHLAKQSGSEIVPIDSEHSAVHQCLAGENYQSIRRIILTASGGPFRTLPKESFNTITVESALRHPNWVMGRKITIDSATLMNKGLEIIEAKWLFGVPMDMIDVIIHPQSIVHSFVEFLDGSIKAQLGMPDMRLPIQYALASPERLPVSYELLDLVRNTPLEFTEPDTDKFPCLRIARESGERGGLYPCILNAANEIAVEAFLKREISFNEIPLLIESALESAPPGSGDILSSENDTEIAETLQKINNCDAETRLRSKEFVNKRK